MKYSAWKSNPVRWRCIFNIVLLLIKHSVVFSLITKRLKLWFDAKGTHIQLHWGHSNGPLRKSIESSIPLTLFKPSLARRKISSRPPACQPLPCQAPGLHYNTSNTRSRRGYMGWWGNPHKHCAGTVFPFMPLLGAENVPDRKSCSFLSVHSRSEWGCQSCGLLFWMPANVNLLLFFL